MEARYSLAQFMREYPDDAACLETLWRERYAPDGSIAACPNCARDRRFHRINARPAYSCDTCGCSLYPLAGTIFHKSSTSLQLWFYAIYLMASTRCGISAKLLERELGVTYKTAWRMCSLIRTKLTSDDKPVAKYPLATVAARGGARLHGQAVEPVEAGLPSAVAGGA
jgi:transposase